MYEYVSIAMDDENLSDEVMDKLLSDEKAGEKWYEYHLISDCLKHKQQPAGRDADFMQSSLFKDALAEISKEHQARFAAQSLKPANSRPAANQAFKGFAVAASLAAVAVSLWQFWPQSDNGADVPVAAEKAQPQQADKVIVPVKADKANEAGQTVLPEAAKQLPAQQTTVHTESKTEAVRQQQGIVQ